MMKPSLCVLSLLASLALGCETTGPVSPGMVSSPSTAVTVTSDLAEVLAVPDINAPQLYTYTADGLLRYQFQLQNKTTQSFFVRIEPTFFDDTGAVVDNQQPMRRAFGPQQIQTIEVVCTNNRGRKVRVQVAPAR